MQEFESSEASVYGSQLGWEVVATVDAVAVAARLECSFG